MKALSKNSNTGIYIIINRLTGRAYVGAVWTEFKIKLGKKREAGFKGRHKNHWARLNNNKHWNPGLQKDWNKYGPEAFEFKIYKRVVCSGTDFIPRVIREEKLAIKKLGSLNLYNSNDGGGGCRNHTLEAKKKISEFNKERQISKKHRRRIRKAQIERYKDPEEVRKTSEAAKICQKGNKNGLGNKSWLGRKLSKKHRKKMSESNKKYYLNPENLKKHSETMKKRWRLKNRL